jgi:glycosyltransferase involved in cell wall biosynthesis
MPLVSVILNSYNQARYLAQAVESVLAQSLDDFELIVIDNGSADQSKAVLNGYACDPRIRLQLCSDNVAITRRFNQGVSLARGQFVSFLYSDDYYLPTKLERQVQAFASLSDDFGVVYGPTHGLNDATGETWVNGSIGASGQVLRRLFSDYQKGQIDMISPLVRKSCLERHPFYEDVFAEGEGVFFRIALSHKFHFLNEPLAVCRDHVGNAGKALKANARMTMTTLDRLERHPEFPKDHLEDLRAYRALLWRSYGWQSVRVGGDVAWARQCFAEAVRVRRREVFQPKLIAGVGLSLLPGRLRHRLNQYGNRLRGVRNNSVYVAEFGGSYGRSHA